MARRHKVRRLVFIFAILAAVSFPVFATEPVGKRAIGAFGQCFGREAHVFGSKGGGCATVPDCQKLCSFLRNAQRDDNGKSVDL